MEFVFGDHRLDVDRRELRRGGERVAIEPQVFDLLVYLLRNRDRVVSKDDLLAAVWDGRIVSESTLTSRINDLRNAVGDSGAAQRLIRTVPRKGLRFVGIVQEQPNRMRASSPGSRLSIVVLPFLNLSNDPEQEYFADGITDDLTTDLSRIAGSFVIARGTAFAFKGKPVDVKQIGHELGVRYLLEGSVRLIGDQVQMNVQLIDAESGGHLWADRFETDRRNVAEAQSAITGRLARTLNLELVKDVGRRIEQEKAIEPEARDLVMLGWAWWHRPRSAATTQQAQQAFERALEIEPHSIDAKIGVAWVLSNKLLGNFVKRSSDSLDQDAVRAEQLLGEAMEFDPNRSIVHSSMGLIRTVQNRLAEARIEFETAIALDPNDSRAHVELALVLLYSGEPDAAIPEAKTALRLSPRDPQLWGFCWPLAACRLLLNEVDAAIDLLIRARTANPRTWIIHFWLAAALGLKGDLGRAKTALAASLEIAPEVDSLARFRANRPWGSPQYWTLFEQTAATGLRRAGLPDVAP